MIFKRLKFKIINLRKIKNLASMHPFSMLLLMSLFIQSSDARCLGDRVFVTVESGKGAIVHEYKLVKSHGASNLFEVSIEEDATDHTASRVERSDEALRTYPITFSTELIETITTTTQNPNIQKSNSMLASQLQTSLVELERQMGQLIIPPEGISRRFELPNTIYTCKYLRSGGHLSITCKEEGAQAWGVHEEYAPPQSFNPFAFMQNITSQLVVRPDVRG